MVVHHAIGSDRPAAIHKSSDDQ
jgi:DnaK suppressor protein